MGHEWMEIMHMVVIMACQQGKESGVDREDGA
jgi:hypothetical protein